MSVRGTPSGAPADLERLGERFVAAFERIHRERMQGLPILNPRLEVELVGGRLHQGDWIGVLITPWSMNLVLVPGLGSPNRPEAIGIKQIVRLPVGEIEAIGSAEEGIGPFVACSLYSPMGGFQDQATAVATAEAIMQGLLEPAAAPADATGASSGAARGLTRRDVLRGVLRRGA